jgi:flagellin-like hook-associated protein FlgL
MAGANAADGCCGGGIPSLSLPVEGWKSGSIFSYGYNWDLTESDDAALNKGKYVAGAYQIGSGTSLSTLLDTVNRGTQSRVRIDFKEGETFTSLAGGSASNNAQRICLEDEIYYLGSGTLVQSACESPEDYKFYAIDQDTENFPETDVATAFAHSVNENSDLFWAKVEDHAYRAGYKSVYVFNKQGGDNDGIFGVDEQLGADVAGISQYASSILWHNDETDQTGLNGSYFCNGGEYWGTLKAQPTGLGTFSVRLDGRDPGDQRDLWILNAGNSSTSTAYDLNFYSYGGAKFGGEALVPSGDNTIRGLNRETFIEVQNASDGDWAGGSIRTQSNAQEALDALDKAIAKKENCRARLGAYINRLENTIENLEIMHDTLQAAESRISDVDIASEMTDFVRNQVLSQAAISILSQANALPEMAMSLLNG